MGKNSKKEYFRAIYRRYREAEAEEKSRILDEFCHICGYNRKYAIAKLNGPAPEEKEPRRRKRKGRYDGVVMAVLAAVWEAAGYLCSVRLKAALPLWLPWIRKRFQISQRTERDLLAISARQMDRRLKHRKRQTRRTIYGRTKPGTLLKHHIPIKTDHWDVKVPGFTEVDLVSHSGNSAAGEFAYSLNQTDILTTWVETCAVLSKSEVAVVDALDRIRQVLPFSLKGIDSDNGSEFVNDHLYRYCIKDQIQFTRGRPYKKDDNAHIEQKNWTHVRKLLGWLRYDSSEAVRAINDLYANELRYFMNLFTPSMKLQSKIRCGSKLKKIYDEPKPPLDRLIQSGKGDPTKIAQLIKLRETLNPFLLSHKIETKLHQISRLAAKSRPNRVVSETNTKNALSNKSNSGAAGEGTPLPTPHPVRVRFLMSQ